jgi:hypothetical protein
MRLAAIRSLAVATLAAALAISLRALLGSFVAGPIHFASPMGVESLFAAAFLAIVLLRCEAGAAPAGKIAPALFAPLPLALAVVAAPFIPYLSDPFLSDDYILVSRATLDPSRILAVFHTPGGDGSFRPLGYLYYALLHHFFGADALKWHACALAVHLINCALLYLIVRTLWPNSVLAFASAVLFGLNGTRPESVAWTAGNFDLLACAFTLAATLAVLRGRVWIALPFLALAIMSKESAYAAPAVIFGFAAAGNRLREPRIRLGLIASAAICAAMFAYRWSLFHGPGGYVNPATGQPQVFSFHLGSALKALFLRVWANLLFPVNWDASAKSAILAAALAAGAGAMLYAAYASRLPLRIVLSMLALTIGALLPAYHLALIGDNLNGSRILYLPAIGFCVLCAHLLRSKPLAAAVAIICTGAVLIHNLDAWHRNAVLADQVCAGATHQAPVHDLNGVVFFANGYKECVEMRRR